MQLGTSVSLKITSFHSSYRGAGYKRITYITAFALDRVSDRFSLYGRTEGVAVVLC